MTVRQRAVLAVVLAAAAVVYLLPTGRRVLYHQDEARFALLARQAVEERRWILPRIRGHVYLNKPPYYFWALAAVSWPLGRVDETTVPLVSVAAALATLGATFAAGRRLWGPEQGLVAVFALATAPFFFGMAHQVLSDMMLTAWLAWALFFYLRAMMDAAPPRWALPAFYLCVGGGLGTKGPAALVVLLAAIGASLAVDGGAGLRRLRLGLGAAIVGLTTLPWLLPYLFQRDGSYTRDVLLGHYADWYFRTKPGSRLDRLRENLAGIVPWVVFLLPAPWWWWRRPDDPGRRRLLVWTAVIGVGVSLSGEQRARYFLPVDALLVLLVGEFVVGAARERIGRWVLAGAMGAGLITTVLGAGYILRQGRALLGRDAIFVPKTSVALWTVIILGLLAWGGALVALARGARGAAVAGCVALPMGVLLAIVALDYPPRYAGRYPMAEFAARVREVVPAGDTIWAYPDASLAYDFYMRREVREIDPAYRVLRRLHDPAVRSVLTRREHWWSFQGAVDPAWHPAVTARIAEQDMVLLRRDVPR